MESPSVLKLLFNLVCSARSALIMHYYTNVFCSSLILSNISDFLMRVETRDSTRPAPADCFPGQISWFIRPTKTITVLKLRDFREFSKILQIRLLFAQTPTGSNKNHSTTIPYDYRGVELGGFSPLPSFGDLFSWEFFENPFFAIYCSTPIKSLLPPTLMY